MNNLKKDLQLVNKELKALAKKVDGIIIAIDKLEKPKATKKLQFKPAKTKTAKKAPARKAAAKKVAVKKRAAY